MKHTYKNYPFLKELKKEGWEFDNYIKHILIASYEKGLKHKFSQMRCICPKNKIIRRYDIRRNKIICVRCGGVIRGKRRIYCKV